MRIKGNHPTVGSDRVALTNPTNKQNFSISTDRSLHRYPRHNKITDSIDEILSRLDGVQSRGVGQWQALCPVHNDHRPSLSVAERHGKVLIYCHAGCAYPDIMEAIGSLPRASNTVERLLAPAGERKPRHIVATYPYHDAKGILLFEKVRYGPVKSFAIRRPDGQGGFIWNRGKREPVLYRLPDLLDPERDWQPVFICEGEKDVDRLTGLSMVATTNYNGAGNWLPEYNQHFAGRVVYILADNDTPGMAHARLIAHHLHSIAKAVKIVLLPGLPDKGDVSDWLEAGHTKDELEKVCLLTASWEPVDNHMEVTDADKVQSIDHGDGLAPTLTPDNLLSYRPEDGGILDLWYDLHGHEWLYTTGFEKWYRWTGIHWQVDEIGYSLKAEIANVMDEMNQLAHSATKAAGDDKTRKQFTAFVNATKRTAARVASVEGLARLRLHVNAGQIDAADMLNLANGTLNLRTLGLSEIVCNQKTTTV